MLNAVKGKAIFNVFFPFVSEHQEENINVSYNEEDYDVNLLKYMLVQNIVREGLSDFVQMCVKLLSKNAKKRLQDGHQFDLAGRCEQCKGKQTCKQSFIDYVFSLHRQHFRQTVNFPNWCNHQWAIATYFMPPNFRKNTSGTKIDLCGFLSFMRTCTLSLNFLENKEICDTVRLFFICLNYINLFFITK